LFRLLTKGIFVGAKFYKVSFFPGGCMKKLVVIACALCLCAGNISAKSLLEKKIFFLNQAGKADSSVYWKIFLGSYQATLERKFPGEDTMPVNTDLNLTLLSSGYIEGYGYTRKGRVDCMGMFMTDSSGTIQKVPTDSMEFMIHEATQAKIKGKSMVKVFVDLEGTKITLSKPLTLTKYKLVVVDEERNLKPAGDEAVTFFAFSKPALLIAQKADKENIAK
jgi:hypothetical protein